MQGFFESLPSRQFIEASLYWFIGSPEGAPRGAYSSCCFLLLANISLECLSHQTFDFESAGLQLVLFLGIIKLSILYLAEGNVGLGYISSNIYGKARRKGTLKQLEVVVAVT